MKAYMRSAFLGICLLSFAVLQVRAETDPSSCVFGRLGLRGRPVRFRFMLKGDSTLYSLWVSPTDRGESSGYLAGGGPSYRGIRDLPTSTEMGLFSPSLSELKLAPNLQNAE